MLDNEHFVQHQSSPSTSGSPVSPPYVRIPRVTPIISPLQPLISRSPESPFLHQGPQSPPHNIRVPSVTPFSPGPQSFFSYIRVPPSSLRQDLQCPPIPYIKVPRVTHLTSGSQELHPFYIRDLLTSDFPASPLYIRVPSVSFLKSRSPEPPYFHQGT